MNKDNYSEESNDTPLYTNDVKEEDPTEGLPRPSSLPDSEENQCP